jgi:transposase
MVPSKGLQENEEVQSFWSHSFQREAATLQSANSFHAVIWARFLKTKVAPFLKKVFPRKRSFNLLLDGEQILHAPEAKAVMRETRITTLPDWPKYSPDLNPQEHVWARSEPRLRELETGWDSFDAWEKKLFKAISQYPSPEKLVGSMARRCQECVTRGGAMLDD